MKRKGIIIQARISSTRLPSKIIRPIENGVTFLDILLSRLVENIEDIPIIIATSENLADEVLLSYGEKYGIEVFRGSESNVLERFVTCAQKFGITEIIRICSDNPFLDLVSLKELIGRYNGEDYLSYHIDGSPSILTHYGFFAEIVSLKALEQILEKGELGCLEHVTNCIYKSSPESDFNVAFLAKKMSLNNVRCTLDTKGDFDNLKYIYENWYKPTGKSDFVLDNLLTFIKGNPRLHKLMNDQIKINSK